MDAGLGSIAWATARCILIGAGLTGCVYDASERCGPDQVYVASENVCRCVDGLVVDSAGDGCVACGDGEVAIDGECECDEGFARSADGEGCEAGSVEGLGDPCDPGADGAGGCAGDFDLCVEAADGAGYCSSGCAEDDDCVGGYACAAGSPDFCQRPPTGQGDACAEQSDCEGEDASFCEGLVIQACLVPGCADTDGACFGDFVCCDFASLGFPSLCVSPDELMDGDCPFGAARIGGTP